MKGIRETKSSTYRDLMGNGKRYEIPEFQRDYTWEEEHWDDLWFDISALRQGEANEHYMGYLVLQSADNKTFQVIDGQQRLTTLSILVLAILRCLTDLVEENIDSDQNKQRIKALRDDYIGYLNPVNLISSNKLVLNRNGDSYYRQHLVLLKNLKDLPKSGINSSQKQMRLCFEWYYKKIQEEKFATGEALAEFIDKLSDQLFFTLILVDKEGSQESEIPELEDLWNQIIDKLQSNKFEDYLRYFWNSCHKTVRKKDLFKTIKRTIQTRKEVFQLVRDLTDTVEIFVALQNPDDENWRDNEELKTALKEIKLFNVKQVLPLHLSGRKHLSPDNFLKLVQATVAISFRYNVIGGRNPNDLEHVYNAFALSIGDPHQFSMNDLRSVYIQDQQFENDFSLKTFKNSQHHIVRYVLGKIEKYGHRNPLDVVVFSVEHILPQGADESWGGDFPKDIENFVYRLGNLTLLETKLNKNADRLGYVKKREIYKDSSCKETQSIAEDYNIWNEGSIDSRQKKLANFAKFIWAIQF